MILFYYKQQYSYRRYNIQVLPCFIFLCIYWTHQALMLTTGISQLRTFLIFHCGKTWSSDCSARYSTWVAYRRKNITYCVGPLSVVRVCETLGRKLCRIIGQLGEPTLYLVHFLFIKENMGEQTLQNCRPCVLSPLSFHSIPLVIVPAEYDLAGRVLC